MRYDSIDWTMTDDHISQRPAPFPSWLVNGERLALILARGDEGVATYEIEGVPAVAWRFDGATEIDRLMLREPSELPSGRVLLLTCWACGDKACMSISAVIEREDDAFVWRDFGWENNYDLEGPWLEDFIGIGPFVFEPMKYEQVLREMYANGVGAEAQAG